MENQEKESNEKDNKKKCGYCGSGFTYVRIKDNSLVCRSCGNIEKLNEAEA